METEFDLHTQENILEENFLPLFLEIAEMLNRLCLAKDINGMVINSVNINAEDKMFSIEFKSC